MWASVQRECCQCGCSCTAEGAPPDEDSTLESNLDSNVDSNPESRLDSTLLWSGFMDTAAFSDGSHNHIRGKWSCKPTALALFIFYAILNYFFWWKKDVAHHACRKNSRSTDYKQTSFHPYRESIFGKISKTISRTWAFNCLWSEIRSAFTPEELCQLVEISAWAFGVNLGIVAFKQRRLFVLNNLFLLFLTTLFARLKAIFVRLMTCSYWCV